MSTCAQRQGYNGGWGDDRRSGFRRTYQGMLVAAMMRMRSSPDVVAPSTCVMNSVFMRRDAAPRRDTTQRGRERTVSARRSALATVSFSTPCHPPTFVLVFFAGAHQRVDLVEKDHGGLLFAGEGKQRLHEFFAFAQVFAHHAGAQGCIGGGR